MVIYVDSLIFTNIIIDYILLLLTGLLTKRTYSIKRLIPASVVGGASSLYILVEGTSVIIDIIFKLALGCLIILIAQSCKKIKDFVVSFTVFLLLSFALSGSIEFIKTITTSSVIFSQNLIGYIDVSPLLIIALTVVIYLVIKLIRRFTDRQTRTVRVHLRLTVCDFEDEYNALLDTGHSLSDPFGDSQVFILDARKFEIIKNSINEKELARRKRVIPASTVGKTVLLEGIRCDRADVADEEKKVSFYSPIVAASAVPLKNDTDAIVSHLVFSRSTD